MSRTVIAGSLVQRARNKRPIYRPRHAVQLFRRQGSQQRASLSHRRRILGDRRGETLIHNRQTDIPGAIASASAATTASTATAVAADRPIIGSREHTERLVEPALPVVHHAKRDCSDPSVEHVPRIGMWVRCIGGEGLGNGERELAKEAARKEQVLLDPLLEPAETSGFRDGLRRHQELHRPKWIGAEPQGGPA